MAAAHPAHAVTAIPKMHHHLLLFFFFFLVLILQIAAIFPCLREKGINQNDSLSVLWGGLGTRPSCQPATAHTQSSSGNTCPLPVSQV